VFVATVLNRSVTLKLQRGERSISAEQYDSATVYFSDVSDFAELSASYNPMQIVAILNEIYKYVKVFWTQLHMGVAVRTSSLRSAVLKENLTDVKFTKCESYA